MCVGYCIQLLNLGSRPILPVLLATIFNLTKHQMGVSGKGWGKEVVSNRSFLSMTLNEFNTGSRSMQLCLSMVEKYNRLSHRAVRGKLRTLCIMFSSALRAFKIRFRFSRSVGLPSTILPYPIRPLAGSWSR